MDKSTGRQKNINASTDESGRLAVINPEKCEPKKCGHECATKCPVNWSGKVCVSVTLDSKMTQIDERLCIGCGICVKKCPFEAIKIRNLPQGIPKDGIHRYGPNMFKLYRLPEPRIGQVLGLLGSNGIGKTTVLQIMTTRIQPNFGNHEHPPSWEEIIKYYKGTELRDYFQGYLDEKHKAALKPQYVEALPKAVKGKVDEIVQKKDKREKAAYYYHKLGLEGSKHKDIKDLSAGELQRFCLMVTFLQNERIYLFDEPSSYLDIRQRLVVSACIREMAGFSVQANYVLVVDHDLTMLDYMSDSVCVMYGESSVYGVVSPAFGVNEGINDYLRGYITAEKMEIRKESLSFTDSGKTEEARKGMKLTTFQYPSMTKKLENFELTIEGGEFITSEIVVMLGENGTGKTSFMKILAGKDSDIKGMMPKTKISYKPQSIMPSFEGTVHDLVLNKIGKIWEVDHMFKQFIFNTCNIMHLFTKDVMSLSGGELQRVGLVMAFGKQADMYLIDEPSAYLDCEFRLLITKGIKKFVLNTQKTAFIVEHDFIMATYLADKVIVFEGEPGKKCTANKPMNMVEGMNKFLSILQITFRRDPSNGRPRINKLDSILDKNQKLSGNYFYAD
jgi:ATP-binding cassette subfamily E protein 1